jgi:hypothetical protein
LLSRFGEAGREHVSAEYNAAVQGERLADRYDDILSTSPRDR